MPKALSLGANNRWWLIRRYLSDLGAKSVLELGCGLGHTGALIAQDYAYVGIEPDDKSRGSAASAVAAHGGTVVDDLIKINQPGGYRFDVICAFEVLEHLEHPEVVVETWLERLVDGGSFIFSVPAHRKRFSASDAAVGHYRRYDAADVVKFTRGLDLKILEMKTVGWPLGWLGELVRAIVAKATKQTNFSKADATSRSGRWLQPGKIFRLILAPVTIISRALQPIGFKYSIGNNWVVLCTRA